MVSKSDIGYRYPCECEYLMELSSGLHTGECDEATYYRNLIESAYKYMTLNTFKQRVPKTTMNEFRKTMKQVAEIVRRNKHERKGMGS